MTHTNEYSNTERIVIKIIKRYGPLRPGEIDEVWHRNGHSKIGGTRWQKAAERTSELTQCGMGMWHLKKNRMKLEKQ